MWQKLSIFLLLSLVIGYAFVLPERPGRGRAASSKLHMAKATWEGVVVAESTKYEVVEGNVYFPPEALNRAYVKDSATKTVCGWKGTASYFDLVVNGKTNKDAVWYYPSTKDAAKNIEGYFAFWKGVQTST